MPASQNAADEPAAPRRGFLKGLRERWDAYWASSRRDREFLDRAEFGTAVSAKRGRETIEGVLVGMDGRHAVLAAGKDDAWTLKKIRRRSLSQLEKKGEVAEVAIPNAEARKARMNRRAEFYRFLERDHASDIAPGVKREILHLRGVQDRKSYLRKIGAEIIARIQSERGVREIGFHYNLHGGTAEGYVTGGGIRAGRGDIALQYTPHGDLAYKVYLFRSSQVNLFDVLNETNPNLVSSRMGNVLNIFESDSDFMRGAFEKGAARKPTAISIDFEDAWINRRGMIAVPYSTYLAPPIEPFLGRSGKRFGLQGRLSKDEETLAAMRYLEAVVLSPF